MANEEHLALLKQGVAPWNQWRRSNPEIVPDLSYANLTDANLSHANLSHANLSNTKLNDAKLIRVDLSEAFLSHAILIRADLIRADLSEAVLGETDLREADLNHANLNRADFTLADLSEANLIMADLTNAALRRTRLRDANLSRADFSGANLSEANLSDANLSGANLGGAILESTILNRAYLDGADFSEVHLRYTSFSDVDLSEVSGLDSVIHHGPSSIGVDTIFNSQGNIPDVFLRGCGLSDTFITYLPSLMGVPIQFYSCFISYSHEDASFARRLHDALQGQGIRCWLDEKQLLPGDNIFDQVDRGIRLWDKVLLCCSKAALTSWWVDSEINSAFGKEQKLMEQRGKKVLALIPLNLDGYLFSDEWENGKKQEVLSRLAPDFTNWDKDNAKFEAQLEQVVKALQTDDTGREPAPPPRL